MDPAPSKSAPNDSSADIIPSPPPLPLELRLARDRFVLSEAPPVAAKTQSSAILVVESGAASTSRRESAVWSGSVMIHVLLLLVIALLVAPADLGGTAMHIIRMSFSDEPDEVKDELSTVEFVSLDAPAVAETVEVDTIVPEPVKLPPDGANATSGSAADESANAGRASEGSDAARGSFFGIEANGHDFVYVLDQSGSMRGQRFRRAADELIRSVNSLNEDQAFFVVLFNTEMAQMFNDKSLAPMPIQATDKNKRKLASWLKQVGPTGGTDPRMGLKLALQMNPSAVFMLSDGEFCDDTKRRKGILHQDDGNTMQMVRRMNGSVPIHAIAYEDPTSCINMRELATLTGGEYRFVAEVRVTEKELVKMVAEADSVADPIEREIALGKLASPFASSQVSEREKTKYLKLLLDAAQAAMDAKRVTDSIRILADQQSVDPEEKQTGVRVSELRDQITAHWRQCRDAKELISAGQALAKMPKSPFLSSLMEAIVPELLRTANAEPVKTYHVLYDLGGRNRGTEIAAACDAGRQKIFDFLSAEANELRKKGDLAGALELLVKLRTHYSGRMIDTVAHEAVLEVSYEILAEARDLGLQRQQGTRDAMRSRLRRILGDDPLYSSLCAEFDGNELRARKLMRRATRASRTGSPEDAREILQAIAKDYPLTITAKKANQELATLGPAKMELDEATLFNQMMGVASGDDERTD